MSEYFAETALLPSGWGRHVRIAVDAAGAIASVDTGAAADQAERLRGVAVPGMPNLHSHAFQRAMVGLAERTTSGADSFWTWREVMYRFVKRIAPEDLSAIAAWAFVEMLKSGYTAVGEFHYLHRDPAGDAYADRAEMSGRIIDAAGRAGIGLTLLPVLYAASGFGGAPVEAAQRRFAIDVDDFLALVESLRGRSAGNLRIGAAPHSLAAVPPGPLGACLEGLHAIDATAPIHIHVAEQVKEVEDCLAWSGARPVEWLIANAAIDGRWCLVHATHMTDGETDALARSGAVAGLCPTTEANLGDGLFPLRKFLDAGGRIGIGSDSQVSIDPTEELRWLEYGQRLRDLRRNVAADEATPSTGARLYRAALAGGAQALGRPIGALAPGRRADVVVLDPEHPSLAGRDTDTLLDTYVFSGTASPPRDVMVGGRWVVRDGRHGDEETIARAWREVVTRLA